MGCKGFEASRVLKPRTNLRALGFRGLQGFSGFEAESLFWLVLKPVSSLSSCALTISTVSLWLHRRTKYVDS